MNTELKGVEIEASFARDDDFAIENAAGSQLGSQRLQKFRKISVERLSISTLDQDLIVVAKDQCAKSVPFWLKKTHIPAWYFCNSFGEHRQDRRIYWKIHASMVYVSAEIQASAS